MRFFAALCVGWTGLMGATLDRSARSCPDVSLARPATHPPRGCGFHCGTERWQVKTLSDPDAWRLQWTPVATTVESLAALPRPIYLPPAGRADGTETNVFCVEGRLAGFTTEQDYDVHIILREELGSPRRSLSKGE